MPNRLLVSALALVAAVSVDRCSYADLILRFDVSVRDREVRVGDQVTWDAFVTISDRPGAEATLDNFGIASASFTLEDSLGETLRPAEIGEEFAGYFPSSGFLEDGRLIEVGVGAFIQNSGTVRGADSDNVSGGSLGPILLATGSFAATLEGEHTLTMSDIGSSESTYFTAEGQIRGLGSRPYEEVQFGSASFRVAAVPEPGSIGLLAAGALMLLRRRARKGIAASR